MISVSRTSVLLGIWAPVGGAKLGSPTRSRVGNVVSLPGCWTRGSVRASGGPQFPQPPRRRRDAQGPGPRGAAPRGCALGRADDITGPGAGRERDGGEGAGRRRGPPPRQAQRPVGLGRATAAMTQGPGGRTPPAPPAPPEPEAPTTFCALLPRMPQWKFAAPAGFLGRSPAAARTAGGAGAADSQPEPAGPAGVPALAAAVLGACEPRCAAPCPLPALSRCRAAGARGSRGARGVAGPPDAAADEWIRKGSFIHKPAHGWLHPDARVLGPGVSYIVRVSAPPGVLGTVSSPDSQVGASLRPSLRRPHPESSLVSLLHPYSSPHQPGPPSPACAARGSGFPPRHVGRGGERAAGGWGARMRR